MVELLCKLTVYRENFLKRSIQLESDQSSLGFVRHKVRAIKRESVEAPIQKTLVGKN
jgi:hypothetical protein